MTQHHMLAILYLMAPLIWPEYRWFMDACLTVEINTWFLIARRWCYKNRVSRPIQQIVVACFYLSWIAIRCIIYPTILAIFLSMVDEGWKRTGTLMHWQMLFLPIHFVLCGLNLKWTYDLFKPIVLEWIGQSDKGNKKGTALSSGL